MQDFLRGVLPNESGFVPIITNDDRGNLRHTQWFLWPTEEKDLLEYVSERTDLDVYFSPMLFTEPKTRRTAGHVAKANVTTVTAVYADGDEADPSVYRVAPTYNVQTSEGHWHNYWVLTDTTDPKIIEQLAHRISVDHKDDGVDNGWALSKRLRVPGTSNTKYEMPFRVGKPSQGEQYTLGEFAAEYEPLEQVEVSQQDIPTDLPGAWDVLNTVQADPELISLFQDTPINDYSRSLFILEMKLFRQGLDAEQVFTVCREAACNKFNRPGRTETELWQHVLVAHETHRKEVAANEPGALTDEEVEEARAPAGKAPTWDNLDMLDQDERAALPLTFIDRYADWCNAQSGLSARQFHEGTAFMILSTIFAEYGHVSPRFGKVGLNLYMLILGYTTKSRKSTAKNFMARVLTALSTDDWSYEIPSDATPEALTEELTSRPGKSSIYWRDEVQGLFEAVKSGGYLRGFFHMLTAAYDGSVDGMLRRTGTTKKTQRTETQLNFYGVGILKHVISAVDDSDFESGWLPRFLWVLDTDMEYPAGSADVEQYDPNEHSAIDTEFNNITLDLSEARMYWAKYKNKTGETALISFTGEAWSRWQRFTVDIDNAARNHATRAEVMSAPSSRMGMSVLKMSAALAMVEMKQQAELHHVQTAIKYATQFIKYTEYAARQVSKTREAQELEEIEEMVLSAGNGVTYRAALKHFKGRKTVREFEELVNWLVQAGSIRMTTNGSVKRLEAM